MDNRLHLSHDHHRSDHWHDNHDHEEDEDTDDGSHLLNYNPSRHPEGFDGAHRSGLLDYQSHHDHVDVGAVDEEEDFVDPPVDAYAGYHNNLGFLHEDEDDIGYGDDQVMAGSSNYNSVHTHGYIKLNGNQWVDSSSQNIPEQIPIPIQTPTPPRRGVKRASESISADYNVNNAGILFDPSSNSPQLAGSPTSIMQASGVGSNNNNNSSKLGKGSGTGSLFFKTKLCIKFRAGTCPYNSNCNFAHGMEELRKPPPGWEDMVAAQEAAAAATAGSGVEASTGSGGGGGGGRNNSSIKENSSGQLVLSGSESLRFRRTRRCKKFYSEEGCPYGERCNFLHDDQVKSRESNAISLGPGSGSGGGVLTTTTAAAATTTTSIGGSNGGVGGNGGGERPSNWKTRMCNKWEMTGHCPFGQKCNFAHGAKELQMYSGAQIDYDTTTIVSNGLLSDNKQTARIANPKLDHASSSYVSTPSYMVDAHSTSRHKSTYLPTSKIEKPTKLLENWKGPSNQISRIYGDWLDDDE